MAQDSALSHARVYLVDYVESPTRKIDQKGQSVYSNLTLHCQEVFYDGRIFGFRSSLKSIKPFGGDVAFPKLDFIPLDLLEKYEEKRDYLVARGQKFWDLRGQHLKEFVNSTLLDQSLVVSSTSLHSEILLPENRHAMLDVRQIYLYCRAY